MRKELLILLKIFSKIFQITININIERRSLLASVCRLRLGFRAERQQSFLVVCAFGQQLADHNYSEIIEMAFNRI